MAWRAHVLQLLLLTASIASTTCGPAFKTAARIQAKIQKQQSLKLRKLQQSSQPLLGLDTKDKKVRVLAFGDSITEGWINSAYIKVPWSPKVQQMLQQKLGSDWNVEVINGGRPTVIVTHSSWTAIAWQLCPAQAAMPRPAA